VARTWQQDAENVWTLRGDEGEILLAVTQHGPDPGQAEPTFRITGGPIDEAQDFPTLAEAREAADRQIDDLES
jgi:hypothetical protein